MIPDTREAIRTCSSFLFAALCVRLFGPGVWGLSESAVLLLFVSFDFLGMFLFASLHLCINHQHTE